MRDSHPDNQGTAQHGRALVVRELASRGATVRDTAQGQIRFLEITSPGGGRARVRVKTRRSGTWQASASQGRSEPAPAEVPTFWVFVDVSSERPAFYVAPDGWVRRDIAAEHARYLDRHGGRRAENVDSDHHAIQLPRIERWRDRWDLLGL